MGPGQIRAKLRFVPRGTFPISAPISKLFHVEQNPPPSIQLRPYDPTLVLNSVRKPEWPPSKPTAVPTAPAPLAHAPSLPAGTSSREQPPWRPHPSLRLWLLLQHHHPAGRFPSSSRRTDNRHLSLSVSATAEDSIGPARTGLPYKKAPSTNAPSHHGLKRRPHRRFQAYPAKCPAHPRKLRRHDRLDHFRRKHLTASCLCRRGCPGRHSEGRRLTVSPGNQPGTLRNRRNHPRVGSCRGGLCIPAARSLSSWHRGWQ